MSSITIRYRFDLERLTSFSNKEKPNLTNLILSYLTPHLLLSILHSNSISECDLALIPFVQTQHIMTEKGVIIVFPTLSIYLPKQQNIPLLRFSTSAFDFLMDVPNFTLSISRAFVDA